MGSLMGLFVDPLAPSHIQISCTQTWLQRDVIFCCYINPSPGTSYHRFYIYVIDLHMWISTDIWHQNPSSWYVCSHTASEEMEVTIKYLSKGRIKKMKTKHNLDLKCVHLHLWFYCIFPYYVVLSLLFFTYKS